MRDLDELLDPVVSRKASAAARTPDFAAVERRGQQRRRRARAAAVGAVVAVAAVVSVVGSEMCIRDRFIQITHGEPPLDRAVFGPAALDRGSIGP